MADELGLTGFMAWLPLSPRRDLRWLLSRVTAGAGEFLEAPNMTWGGTGWETLAAGKPLLQAFKFSGTAFQEAFGTPAPPLLRVDSDEDIANHLQALVQSQDFGAGLGTAAMKWFDTYNGVGLAKRWVEILTEVVKSKTDNGLRSAGIEK